jgi:hypothetical protein
MAAGTSTFGAIINLAKVRTFFLFPYLSFGKENFYACCSFVLEPVYWHCLLPQPVGAYYYIPLC